ncbi:MAG: phosphoadenosine phosphosulfate reductase family protein, partial [Hydrogenimonas sp.]|nr:phosphoadenosine phosphosulfate reductase family protein [Hydrogenimonas sp.]
MDDILKLYKNYFVRFENSEAEEILDFFLKEFKGEIALATSFGAEDQVLIDMVSSMEPACQIFTLETGRLPEETYRVWERSEKHYGISIEPYYPERESLEELVKSQGVNGFYDSIENRKRCCSVRKIETLKRALQGKKAWIT